MIVTEVSRESKRKGSEYRSRQNKNSEISISEMRDASDEISLEHSRRGY